MMMRNTIFIRRALAPAAALGALLCGTYFLRGGAVAQPSHARVAALAPASADAFVNSVGAVTHFNYRGTPYVEKYQAVADALVASGIKHIRDGEPGDHHPQALSMLGQRGVHHSALFPVDTTREQILSTLRDYAPYVDFVEPANEWDIKSVTRPAWADEWRHEQQLLYTTVHSDPADAAITVVGPAPGRLRLAGQLGALDQYEDVGAMHHYPCNLNPGATRSSVSLPAITAIVRQITASKPLWTTEVGYDDDPEDVRCGLTDAVIAKYAPRLLAERWLAGQARTYFYQFSDMGAVHGYDAMGFVTIDGTPKPQHAALASMLHLLSDPGPAFVPAPLAYEITGASDSVHQLLLEKRDRTYVLMLWLEVPDWNEATRSAIDIAPQTVSLTLPAVPAHTVRYAYSSNWKLVPNAVSGHAKTFEIPVSDSISFIEMHF